MNENPLGPLGAYAEGRGHTVSMMKPKALEIDHAELLRLAKADVQDRFEEAARQEAVGQLTKIQRAQEADPHGRDPHSPGSKLDAGKLQIVTHFLHYFPRACAAVTEVSDYGAQKYTSRGWVEVPNGFQRYTDALGRHLIAEGYESHDADTGLSHAAHLAWNALARLELMLQGKD